MCEPILCQPPQKGDINICFSISDIEWVNASLALNLMDRAWALFFGLSWGSGHAWVYISCYQAVVTRLAIPEPSQRVLLILSLFSLDFFSTFMVIEKIVD